MTTHTRAKPPGTPTWVDVMAPDAEAARDFYKKVFGWAYDVSGPEFGGYATARVGDRASAGVAGVPPDMTNLPAAWSVYFATDDIGADVERAAELGGQVIFPTMEVGTFGSMATCADPTGAMFGFWKAGQHIGFTITDEPGGPTWHELYTSDAKRARDYYTALLGATADLMEGGLEYYVLKHGDTSIAGIMQIDPSWGPLPTQWVSYFMVADVEATVAAITANGGKVMGPIDDSPFGRFAAVQDPNGATFKVIQAPK